MATSDLPTQEPTNEAIKRITAEHPFSAAVTAVEGAIVIDQIKNKNDIPKMKDLNRYVINKCAAKWKDVGLELDLDLDILNIIQTNNPGKCESCFQNTLQKWLKSGANATWKTLEVALTNVNRQQIGLDPVDDIYESTNVSKRSRNDDLKVPRVVDDLRNDLHHRYGTRRQKPQQEQWPPNQPKSIVSVALMHCKRRGTQQELIRIFKDSEQKDARTILYKLASSHSRVTKDISEIFKTYSGTDSDEPPKHILIEGAPGIGKTVLAKEIAYLWASGKLLQDCRLVFLVYLRDPRVYNVRSLKDFLQLFTVKEVSSDLLRFVEDTRGKNVAFILDGLDEYPVSTRNKSFIEILVEKNEDLGLLVYKSTVVITSRPSATLFLHEIIDKRIEILGFAKEEREQYISLALNNSPAEKQELQTYLTQHPIINSLCYIPLHLAILLYLFENGSKPDTLTEMNKFFVLHTIYRYLKRHGLVPSGTIYNYELTGFNDLSEENNYYELILKLAKLAFDGLQQNKLVFTFKDINKICPEVVDSQNINGFGLLQTVQHYPTTGIGAGITVSFNFIHFTIQEYLAALHVSTLSTLQQSILMGQTFWDGQFSVMWMMYVGIVGINSPAFVSFISTFVDTFPSSRNMSGSQIYNKTISQDIQIDKRKCLHLFQCYVEAKCDKMPETISSMFSSGKIKLSGITLLPHHIFSLIFFMSASTAQNWKILDLNNCNLRNIGMNSLLERCVDNKGNMISLEYVDLSKNNASPWGVYCVVIRHCCVDSITLCGDDRMEEHVKEITDSLEANRKLKSLKLYSIGRTGIKTMKEVLVSNSTLHAVYFSLEKISSEIKSTNMNILLQTKYRNFDGVAVCNSDRVVDIIVLDESYYGPIPNTLYLSNKGLSEDAVALITFGLCNNTTVKELDVSCNKISDDGALAISNCIQLNSTLKVLNFSLCSITETGMNYLLESVKNPSIIRYIDLSRNDSSPWGVYCAIIRHCCVNSLTLCGDDGIEGYINEITDSLESNRQLQTLTLCSIGNVGLREIRKILVNNTTLSMINLSWTKISDAGTRDKRNILLHTKCTLNKTLDCEIKMNSSYRDLTINILHESHCRPAPKKIILSNMLINDDLVAFIAFGLYNNTRLCHLDLSYNYITNEGAILFATAYKDSSALEQLNLSNNTISDDGAISIGDCLEHNKMLKVLDLSSNKLSSTGLSKFAGSLKNAPMLEFVDLSGNDCSPWGAYCIIIIKNCHLNKLAVCGDNEMELYTKEITHSLETNKGLKSLTLCNIGRIGVESIKNVLANNMTLTTLNLSWNKFMYEKSKILLHTAKFPLTKLGNQTVNRTVSINILNDDSYPCVALVPSEINISQIYDNNIMVMTLGLYYNTVVQALDLSFDNNITDEGAKEIAIVIENNSTLQKLDISNNKISYDGIVTICNSLKNNNTLVEIVISTISNTAFRVNTKHSYLSFKDIDDIEMLIIMSLLYNNHNAELTELNISHCRLSDTRAIAVGGLFLTSTSLQKINISHSKIPRSGIAAISKSLQFNDSLQELNMSHIEIKYDETVNIADAIQANRTLQKLDISHCGITVDGALGISESCKINKTLQDLSISWKPDNFTIDSASCCILHNKSVGDNGALIISNILYSNKKVRKLNLSQNSITDIGILGICNSLKENTFLQELDISCNAITIEGTKAIAEIIELNTSLQSLNISYCGICDNGIAAIVDSVIRNNTLQELNMSHNNSTIVDANNIAKIFQTSTALQNLNISHCGISGGGTICDSTLQEPYMSKCEITTEVANSIQILNISYNNINHRTIAEIVHISKQLQALDISHCVVEVASICDSIKKNNVLQDLNMSYNKITIEEAVKLTEALQMNTTLRKLDISSCDVTDNGAKIIFEGFKNNGYVQELYMLNNKITINAANMLNGLLQINTTLHKLDISNCDRTNPSTLIIFGAVKKTALYKNYTCEITRLLLLFRKDIGNAGKVVLSNLLHSIYSREITEFDLSHCNISDDGVEYICKWLREWNALKVLNLSHNRFTDEGAYNIGKLFENNKLQELNLSHCSISDDAVVYISHQLKKNRTLKVLSLSHNRFTDKGAYCIALCISDNTVLQKLDISYCGITRDVVDKIRCCLKQNNVLQELLIQQ